MIVNRILLALSFVSAPLSAFPLPLKKMIGQEEKKQEARFEAIIFIPEIAQMRKKAAEPGVNASSVPFLSSHSEFLQQVQNRYLYRPVTKEALESLQKDVASLYQSYGRDLVTVTIPEQEITQGVIFIVVQEAKVGEVKITGNRYFSEKSIRNKIHAKEGGPLDVETLKNDVSWINNSPFRDANVVLSPGEKAGETDLEVVVQDRWPYRFYSGVDNTGTEITGKLRLFTGVNFGNLFGCDQRLSYQFTSGTDYDHFHAHTVDYLAPLPWRHFLHIYGGYSEARPDMGNEDLHLEGKNWQVDARYQIPLNHTSGSLLQQIEFGADFKRINNNLEFGGDLIQSQYINVIQGILEYENGYQNKRWKSNLDLRLYGSPGGIGKDNTTSRFQTLRPYAKSHYIIFDVEWSWAVLLQKKGWWLTNDIWGQVTTTNLLPTEQLILGGYNSIRGYEQSEVTVDDGVATSVELHTPTVSLLKLAGCKNCNDTLYFLGFLDYGWGRNHRLTPGEKDGISLLGVGAGARYQIRSNLSARFDYAFPLIDPPYSPKRTQRIFFGVVVSY